MGSQDKLSIFDAQFKDGKDGKDNLEAVRNKKTEETVTGKPRCWCGRVHRIARPLRVVELLILAALLALTIYLTVRKGETIMIGAAPVLLITLFSTYLFILSVDLVSQIILGTLPDTPMFVFVALGFLLFVGATEAIYVQMYLENANTFLLVIMILCMVVAVLFLIDVTLIILNWRQACMRIEKCPFGKPAPSFDTIEKPVDNYVERIAVRTCDPLILRDNVHDVTTSISDYERLSHPDLVNLHKFRKIGVGFRRDYIERSVDAPSLTRVKVIQVQTEPPVKKKVCNAETLNIADVKEELVQTAPKCPVCSNHWDRQKIRRADPFGLCPTFLHLTQGFGMCTCCPATCPAPGASRAESCVTSTSATNVETSARGNQEQSSRKNSRGEK